MAPQDPAVTEEELEQVIRELEEAIASRPAIPDDDEPEPERRLDSDGRMVREPVQDTGRSAHSGYRFNPHVGQFGFSGAFDTAQDKKIKELEKQVEKLQAQMNLISSEVVSGLAGCTQQDILRKALEAIEESKVKRPKPKRRIEIED